MSIQIYILNASGNLSLYKDSLQKNTRSAILKIRNRIALKNIDIIIKESERPDLLKNMDGIGGYCPSEYFIQLDVDTKHSSFRKFPKQIIEQTLAHELHHAARRQANIKIFGGSFLECMFSEGLANYFAYELTRNLSAQTTVLSEKNKKRLMERAKRKFRKTITREDFKDWFTVGSKKLKIPRWSGYALGFEIVKKYLKNNPQKSAASLVTIPVGKILKITK